MFKCDNCDQRFDHEDQLKHLFPDIPDLLQRLDVGGIVPAGECPLCGALVYPEPQPIRVLVLLDGGLVQDVLTDNAGMEVAVLDMDVDGVDEKLEEVVDVTGKKTSLRGTLQAQEVTVAPALVESAWRTL